MERPPQRPTARHPEGRPAPVSEYARRAAPAPQGLDPHGRPAPVHNSPEDDQLDIPAFLRRQAN
jgi:cell division protein FtsZ